MTGRDTPCDPVTQGLYLPDVCRMVTEVTQQLLYAMDILHWPLQGPQD